MAAHLRFAIEDPSQVGQARRAALQLAQELDFDDTSAGRVALVVTELANNLLRHARQGQLLVGAAALAPGLDVVAIDRGPGMDLARCLQDGYSTGGTAGTGLGAVRRLADRFDVHSAADGTLLLAGMAPGGRVPPRAGAFEVAVLSIPAPGEVVCGDRCAVVVDGRRAAVMLADGLGHGPEAAVAAAAVVDAFLAAPFAAPAATLELGHRRAQATRGAAASLCLLDDGDAPVVFGGAGNVACRLVSGTTDRTLLAQHGTLGLQLRRLQDTRCAWPEHGCLVMHSDGIGTRWTVQTAPALLQRDPMLLAAWLVRDHLRGRDDAAVAVVRRAGAPA